MKKLIALFAILALSGTAYAALGLEVSSNCADRGDDRNTVHWTLNNTNRHSLTVSYKYPLTSTDRLEQVTIPAGGVADIAVQNVFTDRGNGLYAEWEYLGDVVFQEFEVNPDCQ